MMGELLQFGLIHLPELHVLPINPEREEGLIHGRSMELRQLIPMTCGLPKHTESEEMEPHFFHVVFSDPLGDGEGVSKGIEGFTARHGNIGEHSLFSSLCPVLPIQATNLVLQGEKGSSCFRRTQLERRDIVITEKGTRDFSDKAGERLLLSRIRHK
jgi:hypothetical protein